MSTRAASHAGELVLVEEIGVAALMAEEQPVASRRLGGHALVQKGAERRDAGARSDHDDRHRRVGRQPEVLRTLDVGVHLLPGRDAVGEEGRGHAEPLRLATG